MFFLLDLYKFSVHEPDSHTQGSFSYEPCGLSRTYPRCWEVCARKHKSRERDSDNAERCLKGWIVFLVSGLG